MNITLNPELEQLINSQLATGKYNSVEDLLKDALLNLADKQNRQTLSKKVKELFDKTQSLAGVQDITEEEIAEEIEAYRREDLKEKWAKGFQEVEEMALTGSEIREKDYENILMDKYKQQGLIL
ncbi:MAG: type II toxin-antitoxin system ParD family antitoxin [Microcystis sp.]